MQVTLKAPVLLMAFIGRDLLQLSEGSLGQAPAQIPMKHTSYPMGGQNVSIAALKPVRHSGQVIHHHMVVHQER
jgi:hypothetical protein